MAKILLVEDNKSYRETLTKILQENGYEVDAVEDPIIGIEYAALTTYDLVISDLVMDVMNGVRFLTLIYKIQPHIKTIILTANPDEETELESIDVKIDYYLSKDRSIFVILRYIKKLLSEDYHKSFRKPLISRTENIVLDPVAYEVYKDDQRMEISHKEFQILEFFLHNKNVALSREDFIKEIWDDSIDSVDTRVIDVHIRRIREKLKVMSITSIRGYGYKWNE